MPPVRGAGWVRGLLAERVVNVAGDLLEGTGTEDGIDGCFDVGTVLDSFQNGLADFAVHFISPLGVGYVIILSWPIGLSTVIGNNSPGIPEIVVNLDSIG